MKLTALCASAVALTLGLTSPASAISQPDKDFVIISAVSWSVLTACPGFEVINGFSRKFADRNGANFDTIAPAILAALNAQLDEPYERSNLIPEVTILVTDGVSSVLRDLNKNKVQACAKWSAMAVDMGFLRPSKK